MTLRRETVSESPNSAEWTSASPATWAMGIVVGNRSTPPLASCNTTGSSSSGRPSTMASLKPGAALAFPRSRVR